MYGFNAVSNSGWFGRTEERTIQSFHLKSANAGFRVENLLVDGRVNIDRKVLKDVIGVEKGNSIFAYDLDQVQQDLAKISWVKSSVVERRLPDTIYVGLQERVPVAIWQKEGKQYLVDAEGAVLTNMDLDRFADALVITGDKAAQNAAELIGLVGVETDLKERIEIARWIGNRRWDLKLKNGIVVRLPEDDAGFAIKKLTEAQKTEQIMDRHVEAIDLRDPMRIVVQTESGAAEKYEAGFKKEKNI